MAAIPTPKVTALSAALCQSKACSAGRVCGRERTANAKVTRPIGTFTAKRYGQLETARMPAAIVGPTAAEVATTMALMPMPRPS